MPIIFGKRSSTPGACGLCAGLGGPFGVTNLKYAKLQDIMWICNNCSGKNNWQRIYSMSSSKLTEIEQRCIGIACVNIRDEFISGILDCIGSTYYEGCGAVIDHDDEKIKEIFLVYSNKLLMEYRNQLIKYNN